MAGSWEYEVIEWDIAERWSGKKQAKELANFRGRLNELGAQGWEMIGYESIPMKSGVLGREAGHAYLCFFKRPR